uniref:Alkaline phosphatase n=1 Tax=Dermatophagoides pteronyssinus TaxID=6956 RepID=A0A6P6Y2Q4_DERPT|nr:alkaline phosphatase-like [Dermatophagoides pteronyssinus]
MKFLLIFFVTFYIVNRIFCAVPEDPQYWRKLTKKTLYYSKKFVHANEIKQAKNAILFLGDGMGFPSISAARLLKRQLTGNYGENLAFEKWDNVAVMKTYNIDFPVPDSAGTATAFCSGVKANYGTIGVNGRVPFKSTDCSLMLENGAETIYEKALKSGKSVGFVTTASVTDATPAGTYAHISSRHFESGLPFEDKRCKDIARQLVEDHKGYQVMLGGGRKHFLPEGKESGGRKDGRNLFEQWQEDMKKQNKRYKFVSTRKELLATDYNKIDYLFGSFSSSHMKFHKELKNDSSETEPTITEMTEAAVKILKKNQKGFLLLVEGAKIDKAHHLNQAYYSLNDLLAFENAIMKAQSILGNKETLMIVTADHSHSFTHSGNALFTEDVFGFSSYPDKEGKNFTNLIYSTGPGYNSSREFTKEQIKQPDYKQLSAVPLDSATHGGDDVGAFGTGPGSNLLRGSQEQTYVAHLMEFSTCIGEYANEPHCSGCKILIFSKILILIVFISHLIRFSFD